MPEGGAVNIVLRMGLSLWLLSTSTIAVAQQGSIDPDTAKQYFDELKSTSDKDGGRLWGIRLYGPVLFVDPTTRQVIANQADKEGHLHQADGVFVGKLPLETPVANTGIDWGGVRWTMVMWPLPQNHRPRTQLLAHESFHRIQPQLGQTPLGNSNNHLDGRIGRTWIQLEWRALTRALQTTGAPRRAAIADALYFRALRRVLISSAAVNENRLEANEGVAEYTGVTLSARYPQEAALVASVILWEGPNRSPFVRNFAYVSGPAYGVLLDESAMPWRKQLKADADLGGLLARAYHIAPFAPAAVTEAEALGRARKYDGNEVIAQEQSRETRQASVMAQARQRFIGNPVLILPTTDTIRYSFDPDEVTALDDSLSVFGGNAQISDAWGVLTATGGTLIVRDQGKITRAQLPAPAHTTSPLEGDGWKLELKPGWELAPGPRPGDWTVAKAP